MMIHDCNVGVRETCLSVMCWYLELELELELVLVSRCLCED